MSRWNYCGDLNLEEGGYYWKEDGADDYVLAVRVTPCSDAGGPSNCFWIEQGSIYMPAGGLKRALDCCGYDATATRAQRVDAFMAYYGVEQDTLNGPTTLQIGKVQKDAKEPVKVDIVIRANWRLKNYVRLNCLD